MRIVDYSSALGLADEDPEPDPVVWIAYHRDGVARAEKMNAYAITGGIRASCSWARATIEDTGALDTGVIYNNMAIMARYRRVALDVLAKWDPQNGR